MLQELTIRNFAIIDDLQIQFSEGLTIISGETGAGKSIILNAVNLLLGSRASAELVRTGAVTNIIPKTESSCDASFPAVTATGCISTGAWLPSRP
jgi:DNA repair ATPase RecN